MSSDPPLLPQDELEALAGEYVLGVLDLPDRRAAEQRLRRDPAFAARVAFWEARFSSLDGGFAPVAAPDLLPGIEARLFPVAPAARGRRFAGVWFAGVWGAALGALAVAGVAGFFLLLPPRPDLVTTLASADAALTYRAEFGQGHLRVTRMTGAAAPAGQVHELWIIEPGAAPQSLGLLGDAAFAMDMPMPPKGSVLAVSMEPAGGSPTGAPTGPVLMTAAVGV